MGTEYIMRFDLDDPGRAEWILENAPFFSGRTDYQGRSFYEFRRPDTLGGMPDATAMIEADGIYFCEYGRSGEILNAILSQVKADFGQAMLQAYEEYLDDRDSGGS